MSEVPNSNEVENIKPKNNKSDDQRRVDALEKQIHHMKELRGAELYDKLSDNGFFYLFVRDPEKLLKNASIDDLEFAKGVAIKKNIAQHIEAFEKEIEKKYIDLFGKDIGLKYRQTRDYLKKEKGAKEPIFSISEINAMLQVPLIENDFKVTQYLESKLKEENKIKN